MKKNQLTDEEFYNYWLQKYHNITIKELLEKEPELCKTKAWYEKYAVTQEQHDEWYEWAITKIMKYYRCSRAIARRNFSSDYINIAPTIKNNNNATNNQL